MNEREVFEKYDNLSENELNTKSNKRVYVRNDNMTFIIKHCRKKMIPESEISECSEYDFKSKIGNIFVNEKIREEYRVKIYENYSCFYEHYQKKVKVH